MSYINVSVTHDWSASDQFLPRTETLDAGFSREGGRLERLATTDQVIGPFPPNTVDWEPTEFLQAASRPLLDAALGAGGVRSVVVEHGFGTQPGTVRWSDRSGTQLGSAAETDVPAGVQAVIDAAYQLDQAMREAASGVAA